MAEQGQAKGASAATTGSAPKSVVLGGLIAGGFGLAAAALALALTGASGQGSAGKDGAVGLSPVTAADLEAALQTIAPDQRDQIRDEVAKCKTALFMMDVGPMPGAKDPASGYVQLRVGTYLSPRFAVGATVTRFAVPHPIPDAKTVVEGAVTVMGTARSARVSFSPSVDYPVLAGSVNQPVYYELPQACGVDTGKP